LKGIPFTAFISPKKILPKAIDLLANDAQESRDVIRRFQPKLDKEEYLKLLDSLSCQQLWESV
jgi:hypothetical protein